GRHVRDVRTMGMDYESMDRRLRKASNLRERRDVASALQMGQQVQDRLQREVPAFVQEEMRKARTRLLNLNLKGNDLAKPIGILEEASTYVKQEDWTEALHQIREFYEDIARLG